MCCLTNHVVSRNPVRLFQLYYKPIDGTILHISLTNCIVYYNENLPMSFHMTQLLVPNQSINQSVIAFRHYTISTHMTIIETVWLDNQVMR